MYKDHTPHICSQIIKTGTLHPSFSLEKETNDQGSIYGIIS